MHLYNSSKEYLYNLEVTSSNEAKKLWRKTIKEKWNNQCAYCGSDKNLTIDHIIPQAKGGNNFLNNVIACCESCNKSKSHDHWEHWFKKQEFFTNDRKSAIINWTNLSEKKELYRYPSRRNNAS